MSYQFECVCVYSLPHSTTPETLRIHVMHCFLLRSYFSTICIAKVWHTITFRDNVLESIVVFFFIRITRGNWKRPATSSAVPIVCLSRGCVGCGTDDPLV